MFTSNGAHLSPKQDWTAVLCQACAVPPGRVGSDHAGAVPCHPLLSWGWVRLPVFPQAGENWGSSHHLLPKLRVNLNKVPVDPATNPWVQPHLSH